MERPVRQLLALPIVLALSLASSSAVQCGSRAAVRLDAELDLLVVVDVPKTLRREVKEVLSDVLAEAPYDHRTVALAELEEGFLATHRVARAVALGSDACQRLAPSGVPTLCALLSAEAFAAVACGAHCERLRAIVMDQPVSRQIAVASSIYPSLVRFGVLGRERPTDKARLPPHLSLDYHAFSAAVALPAQLDGALAGNDALVALPDSTIFNRETLHVVLLTAYGYAKPVIGFSRAYVRAGALISTYATPEQVLRDVFEDVAVERAGQGLEGSGARDEPRWFEDERMRPSTRFSVAENRRIARSLGLSRRVPIEPGQDYRDENFPL